MLQMWCKYAPISQMNFPRKQANNGSSCTRFDTKFNGVNKDTKLTSPSAKRSLTLVSAVGDVGNAFWDLLASSSEQSEHRK